MPGTDPREAAAIVAGELPDLPHLVELPERGAGAEMIGRTAALLVDMPVEVAASGWRLTRRPGSDLRHARDLLARDVDATEEHLAGTRWLKVQLAGPWTLAAHLEIPSGHRVLTDDGAVRDLIASLTEGLATHLTDLARRLPGTGLVVQIDEPSLPEVLAGSLPTASGLSRIAAVDPVTARRVLADLVSSLGGRPTVAHCCHVDAPITLLREAGVGALSIDLTGPEQHTTARLDDIGAVLDTGAVLVAGVARPGATSYPSSPASMAALVTDLWHRLGLPAADLARTALSPGCGLADVEPARARQLLGDLRDAGRRIEEAAHS